MGRMLYREGRGGENGKTGSDIAAEDGDAAEVEGERGRGGAGDVMLAAVSGVACKTRRNRISTLIDNRANKSCRSVILARDNCNCCEMDLIEHGQDKGKDGVVLVGCGTAGDRDRGSGVRAPRNLEARASEGVPIALHVRSVRVSTFDRKQGQICTD